jgi:hypothetical protein
METIYRLSGATEVAFESEACEECRDDEAHTLDRALLQTPYPFYDVTVIPRSEGADDDGSVQRLGGWGRKRYDRSGRCRLGDRGWGGFCGWSKRGLTAGHGVST